MINQLPTFNRLFAAFLFPLALLAQNADPDDNDGGNGNAGTNTDAAAPVNGGDSASPNIPSTPAEPFTPQVKGQVSNETDDRVSIVRTGTVNNMRLLRELSFDDARVLVKSVKNLGQLKKIIREFGTYDEFVEETGGLGSLIDLLKDGKDLEEALEELMDSGDEPSDVDDDLIGEAADLINEIFQDVMITGGALEENRIFNRARLFANEFNVTMIATAAKMLGYEDIGNDITSSVSASSLNQNNSFIGNLTEVLTNTKNLGLLGLGEQTKKIGNLFDLTTNDFEAFAGNKVTIDATSTVDLAEFNTKIFAIVGGEEMNVASDVTFSDRSSSWDKEALAIGAAKKLEITPGTTIEYQGNYLGLGAGKSIEIQQVTIKAGSGVGVGTLENLTIEDSVLELTNSQGGFGLFAGELLSVDGLTFVGNSIEHIYMEARTINLKDVDFPLGSSVDLLSELGPIDGKYPNFGDSIPGRVNFLSGVSYGGTTNVMDDQPSFDQFGENINIKQF